MNCWASYDGAYLTHWVARDSGGHYLCCGWKKSVGPNCCKKKKKEFKKKSQDGLFLFAHLTHHSFRTTAALSLHTDSI
jgi:hypothetical protein